MPIGVIILDVGNFKRLDDTFGYCAGDRMLNSMLQAAGSALAEAKHGGRDRVAVAPAI